MKIMEYLQGKINGEWAGRHAELAELTGVNKMSIWHISKGLRDPQLKTVQPLLDKFLADDAKAKRSRKRAGTEH